MKDILYHFKGVQFLVQQLARGKYISYFIPGLIITILYWLLMDSASGWSDFSTRWTWLNTFLSWIFSGLGFATEKIYIFIVLTLLSPFNTSLAEKVDEELTGHTVKNSLLLFINDMIRMIFVVLIMIVLELLFLSVYWLISWVIPDFINTIVYFVISAFFFGLSYYDFALERYKQNVFATVGYAFKKPLGMLITGAIFLAIYEIPYVGIPISPVVAVVISTVAYAYYNNYTQDKNALKTIENE